MSDIPPIGPTSLPALERSSRSAGSASPSTATPREADHAELSDNARLLSALSELPDVRQDLIDSVRAQIEAGTYDTPDKVDALLDNLAEDLT